MKSKSTEYSVVFEPEMKSKSTEYSVVFESEQHITKKFQEMGKCPRFKKFK